MSEASIDFLAIGLFSGDGGPLTEEGTILARSAILSSGTGRWQESRCSLRHFFVRIRALRNGYRAARFCRRIQNVLACGSPAQEPQPASQSAADIPPELDRIIARSMKKDPARRWQSMAT